MLARSLIILALLTPVPRAVAARPEEHRGFAAHYRPGLMERVARRRGLPKTECMIASPFYELGSWVQVRSEKYDQVLRCRVTDVPQPRHRALLKKRTIVVELDFASAKTLCNIKRVGQEPPRACPVVLTRSRAK